jgi:hypothetical protein
MSSHFSLRLLLFLFIQCVVLLHTVVFAQAERKIARHHNRQVTLYPFDELIDAIEQSGNNDTLYLPGGRFDLQGDNIFLDKGIHIVGVGHHPDSSRSTDRTEIAGGDLIALAGVNGASVTGIYLEQNVRLGTSPIDQDVQNFRLNRCSVNDIYFTSCRRDSCGSAAQNLIFRQNVIRGSVYGGGDIVQVSFEQNIFNGHVFFFDKSSVLFKNNLFLANTTNDRRYFNRSRNLNLFDNIFVSLVKHDTGYCYKDTSTVNILVRNNMFLADRSLLDAGLHESNIIDLKSVDSVFKSVPDFNFRFSYAHNYQLKENSTGRNSGSDRRDRGLFGGRIPMKANYLPFNPHIFEREVDPYLTRSGRLRIRIGAEAQSH